MNHDFDKGLYSSRSRPFLAPLLVLLPLPGSCSSFFSSLYSLLSTLYSLLSTLYSLFSTLLSTLYSPFVRFSVPPLFAVPIFLFLRYGAPRHAAPVPTVAAVSPSSSATRSLKTGSRASSVPGLHVYGCLFLSLLLVNACTCVFMHIIYIHARRDTRVRICTYFIAPTRRQKHVYGSLE